VIGWPVAAFAGDTYFGVSGVNGVNATVSAAPVAFAHFRSNIALK
jgi:hypothetical protein